MGELDWGPVLGAYVASLLLAGAYISVGLFVSSRTENQIVSLILTAFILLSFLFSWLRNASCLFWRYCWRTLAGVGYGVPLSVNHPRRS